MYPRCTINAELGGILRHHGAVMFHKALSVKGRWCFLLSSIDRVLADNVR